MKTLYVNGKFLSQTMTGVQRYAMGVTRAWDEAMERGEIDPSEYRIRVLAPKVRQKLPDFKHVDVVQCKYLGGRIWEQLYLPLRTVGSVLFSPFAAAPVAKLRQAVTIHDAGVRATRSSTPKGSAPGMGSSTAPLACLLRLFSRFPNFQKRSCTVIFRFLFQSW